MSNTAITVRVDDEEIRMRLRQAARIVQRDANQAVGRYADRHVVPLAQSLAPTIIRHTLTTRVAAKGVWLTTTARGKKRAIVGVSNFGGVIRAPINPRRRKALRMPDGRFVARVTTPRTMPARRYMEKSIERHKAGLIRHLDEAITASMRERIVGIER